MAGLWAGMTSCWFAEVFDDPDIYEVGPCDGPMDRCHLIPKQRIKRELEGAPPMMVEEAVWHPSVWVSGCHRHHGNFDARMIRVMRSQLPPAVEHFAEVFEMEYFLTRDYGSRG